VSTSSRPLKRRITIVAIARHIAAHGVDGRFYSQARKHHHEGGKAYWFMDNTLESRR